MKNILFFLIPLFFACSEDGGIPECDKSDSKPVGAWCKDGTYQNHKDSTTCVNNGGVERWFCQSK